MKLFRKIAFIFPFYLSCIGIAFSSDFPKTVLSFSTGTYSGTYFKIGKSFCNLISESSYTHNIKCLSRTTSGSVENISIVLRDKTSIGMAQGETLIRSEKASDLRILAKIYNEPLFIVASKNASVKNFEDILLQKNINIGLQNSGENIVAKAIIKAKNWQRNDLLEIGRYDITSMFCKNAVDIAFFVEQIKSSFIENIMQKCSARLISVNEEFIKTFLSSNKEFLEFTIPANSYTNQPFEIKTIASETFLFASKDMPEELAYNILKSIFGDIKKLQNSNPVLQNSNLNSFFPKDLGNKGISLHKGAEKFLKEIEENNNSINKT